MYDFQPTIRSVQEDDLPTIESLAVQAGMFTPEEVGFLSEQFRQGIEHDDAHWLVLEVDKEILAAAYYSPEPYADRMWNLYFIVVSPSHHGQGLGRQLMSHIEQALRAKGPTVARTLIVETSSTSKYERTRAFYRRLGYAEEARIRQFYGPEDHKVIFWKSLVE